MALKVQQFGTALITSFIWCACDGNSEKESDKDHNDSTYCQPGYTQSQPQTGLPSASPTATTLQAGLPLAAGDLFQKIQMDCAMSGCHVSGSTTTSDFTVPANVNTAAATILQRISLQPGTTGFMPQNAVVPYASLSLFQAWQTAGFPDISIYDSSMTNGGSTGYQPINTDPTQVNPYGTASNNCQPTSTIPGGTGYTPSPVPATTPTTQGGTTF